MKWWKFICRAGRLYIWTHGNHDKMCMHKSGKILVWMWGSGHAVSPWAEKILTICSFVNSFVESGSETLLSRCNLCRRTTLQGRHQIFGQHKLDLTTFVGCVIAVLFLFICLLSDAEYTWTKVTLRSVRWRAQMIKIQSMKCLICHIIIIIKKESYFKRKSKN